MIILRLSGERDKAPAVAEALALRPGGILTSLIIMPGRHVKTMISSLDVGRRFHIRKAAKDRKYHWLYYQQWETIGCTKNYGAISGKRLSRHCQRFALPQGIQA
ncbi:hypothetical protein TNCV_1662821 [Trichonephila clavipes]|nr:hypothetical protein TNCV_1662821 [Trichonephila clavipes]